MAVHWEMAFAISSMYSINDKRVPAVTQRARHGNVRPTIDIAINAQCMLGLGAAVQAFIYMSHYIYTDLDVKGVVSKSNKTKISERRRLFSRVYCSCARKFDFFLWIKSNLRFNRPTANVKHWQAGLSSYQPATSPVDIGTLIGRLSPVCKWISSNFSPVHTIHACTHTSGVTFWVSGSTSFQSWLPCLERGCGKGLSST